PLTSLIGESVADSELHWQDPKRSKLRRFWFLLGLRPRHRGSGPFRHSCYGPPIQPAYPAKTAPAAMKTRAVGRDRLCHHGGPTAPRTNQAMNHVKPTATEINAAVCRRWPRIRLGEGSAATRRRRWRVNTKTIVHITITTAKSKRIGRHLISETDSPPVDE